MPLDFLNAENGTAYFADSSKTVFVSLKHKRITAKVRYSLNVLKKLLFFSSLLIYNIPVEIICQEKIGDKMIFGKTKCGRYEALIVGIGNVGLQYEGTRHNIGFVTVDELCKKHGIAFNKHKFKSAIADGFIDGKRVLVIKPQTYVNLSGEAVKEVCDFYKIPANKVIVVSDDISLPVGKIRIRKKGSDGGHNGLKNVILMLNTDGFIRVRIGVGKKPSPEYDMVKFVLGRFPPEQMEDLNKAVQNAVSAIEETVCKSIENAMNDFN